jgi:hypothetical protein
LEHANTAAQQAQMNAAVDAMQKRFAQTTGFQPPGSLHGQIIQ